MDFRTRQGLINAMAGKVGKRMDALLVPLELLSCVSRTEFSDKKAYIRWQKRQVSPFSSLTYPSSIANLVSLPYLIVHGWVEILYDFI